jgi:hypothetical protein
MREMDELKRALDRLPTKRDYTLGMIAFVVVTGILIVWLL